MIKKLVHMATVAVIASLGVSAPTTGFAGPVDVNIQLSGYLPTPPGVRIYFESGRPYYVEKNRRVYVAKKSKGNKGKHLGQYKDEDRGRNNGHGKKHGRN